VPPLPWFEIPARDTDGALKCRVTLRSGKSGRTAAGTTSAPNFFRSTCYCFGGVAGFLFKLAGVLAESADGWT
jgi:hypothetical protein